MSESEILDIFDDNMKIIGQRTREEVHKEGFWHQSFHCWLVRQERLKKHVLFQRRGPNKKVYPNFLDVTAAGHLLTGESAQDGLRELTEELGIDAKFEDLIPLGIRFDVAIVGAVTNREFCNTYLLESNLPLDAYKLQTDEVSALVQMEIHAGLKLFSGESEYAKVNGSSIDEYGTKHNIDIKVSLGDFIPKLDRYYLKVFITADRYFKGIKQLGI